MSDYEDVVKVQVDVIVEVETEERVLSRILHSTLR
jgi:hypothetical protein